MKKQQGNPWHMVALLSAVGMEIILFTVGGAWLGRQLDGIILSEPFGLLIGLLLGLGFGFVSAFFTLKQLTKE